MEVKGQLHTPHKQPPLPTALGIEQQPYSFYCVTMPTELILALEC
jgi:hypothetical protein